jgi:hypothetical protein
VWSFVTATKQGQKLSPHLTDANRFYTSGWPSDQLSHLTFEMLNGKTLVVNAHDFALHIDDFVSGLHSVFGPLHSFQSSIVNIKGAAIMAYRSCAVRRYFLAVRTDGTHDCPSNCLWQGSRYDEIDTLTKLTNDEQLTANLHLMEASSRYMVTYPIQRYIILDHQSFVCRSEHH